MNIPLQHSQIEPQAAAGVPRRPDWITYATEQLRQASRPVANDRPKASKS